MPLSTLLRNSHTNGIIFSYNDDEVLAIGRECAARIAEDVVDYLRVFGAGEWAFGLVVGIPFAPMPDPGLLTRVIRAGWEKSLGNDGRNDDLVCFGYSTMSSQSYGTPMESGRHGIYLLSHEGGPTLVAGSLEELIELEKEKFRSRSGENSAFYSSVTEAKLPLWREARAKFRVARNL